MDSSITSPGQSGLHHIIKLADDGIFEICIEGVWDIARVDAFFAEFQPSHTRVRSARGRVLTLIVVGSVQSPLVALHVRNRAVALKRPGDRNAVVISSVLARLQIARIASGKDFAIFTDPAAARGWLLDTTDA